MVNIVCKLELVMTELFQIESFKKKSGDRYIRAQIH